MWRSAKASSSRPGCRRPGPRRGPRPFGGGSIASARWAELLRLRAEGVPQLLLEVVLRGDDPPHEDHDLPDRVQPMALAVLAVPLKEVRIDADVELALRGLSWHPAGPSLPL